MRISPLLSDFFKAYWFMEYQSAIAASADIYRLMNRDWDGGMTTEDLEASRDRAPLPVAVIGASGNSNPNFDQAPSGSTAIIPLKGTMLKYGTMCTYGTQEIASALLEAASHKNISAIVMDIDSGGGAVDAVAPVVDAIRKAKADYGKPVVASCDTCASAAYWSATQCDKIVANNDISAAFGSIGVMMSFHDMQPYYEQMGIKFHTIFAPESDYKNRPFLLALEGKYDEIQKEMLSPLAVKFQNAVKANRPSLKSETKGILNGRMFYASDALDNGLIDKIGTMQTAIDTARELADQTFVNQYTHSKK